MLKQPQIYLDSNDFSLLSDPRRLDQTNIALRDELQGYADKSLVQFRFSMAHVCEAAPTGPHAQEAAERRAELIYKLCGLLCVRSSRCSFANVGHRKPKLD